MQKKENLSKVGIRGKFLSLIKDIYKKATANIKLNGQSVFSQRQHPFLIFLFPQFYALSINLSFFTKEVSQDVSLYILSLFSLFSLFSAPPSLTSLPISLCWRAQTCLTLHGICFLMLDNLQVLAAPSHLPLALELSRQVLGFYFSELQPYLHIFVMKLFLTKRKGKLSKIKLTHVLEAVVV